MCNNMVIKYVLTYRGQIILQNINTAIRNVILCIQMAAAEHRV